MRRLLPFLSLITLAIWLTATQHCALEEANILKNTCTEHGVASHAAGTDGCANVEDGSYKLASATLKVSAPFLFLCVCLLCLYRVSLNEPVEQAFAVGDSSSHAKNWIANWHFVRRDAPLPGAPSFVVA